MAEFKCTTANAMFAGLQYLADKERFHLALVSEIAGESVLAFELCGPGLIVIQNTLPDSWVLKLTSAAQDMYPMDPRHHPLIHKYFDGGYSTEGTLMNLVMLLSFMREWTGEDCNNMLLATARRAEHMFGGF
jgi:hypothetical protein